jgi:hypothetical protein
LNSISTNFELTKVLKEAVNKLPCSWLRSQGILTDLIALLVPLRLGIALHPPMEERLPLVFENLMVFAIVLDPITISKDTRPVKTARIPIERISFQEGIEQAISFSKCAYKARWS